MSQQQTKKDLLISLEKLTQALKRERADAINVRQRFLKEKAELSSSAKMEILQKLLPIFDNLDRALFNLPEHLSSDNWGKGVLGIQKQLQDELKSLDLKVIPTLNQSFDPRLMEAIATKKNADLADGTVIEEIAKGYWYKDQVLRPAKVIISSA